MPETIQQNLSNIRERMVQAATRAGRDPNDITLLAVSKRHPTSSIKAAYDAGQRDFAENYAQELRDKANDLASLPDIRWHFIGHLQRNKIKYVAKSATVMHCVDTVEIATALSTHLQKLERTMKLLLQVNVGNEAQKSGCTVEAAPAIIEQMEMLPNVQLAGLMTILPFDLKENDNRALYHTLYELRERLGGAKRLPHLSMGMSNDFEQAIMEGATLVRVGTAIFGERPPKTV